MAHSLAEHLNQNGDLRTYALILVWLNQELDQGFSASALLAFQAG